MKKFGAFLLTILAVFTCFIFSACQSKYANLNMEFLTEGGETLEGVNLTLDEEDDDAPNQITLAVKVTGIKAEDIGLIEVNHGVEKFVFFSLIEEFKKNFKEFL